MSYCTLLNNNQKNEMTKDNAEMIAVDLAKIILVEMIHKQPSISFHMGHTSEDSQERAKTYAKVYTAVYASVYTNLLDVLYPVMGKGSVIKTRK